jgi:nickel/cobalt transporter (NicO) family protein
MQNGPDCLWAVCVWGGIPCSESIGILLVAIGVNHIPLGSGMIVCFRLGLVTVLIGLGAALGRIQIHMELKTTF